MPWKYTNVSFYQHKVDHLTLNIQTMNFKCLSIIPAIKKPVNGIGWNIPVASTGNEWGGSGRMQSLSLNELCHQHRELTNVIPGSGKFLFT
jgi:hypothetical protein